MPKVQGLCEECSKPIEYYPSQARRFCSLSCRSKWVGRASWPPGEYRSLKPRRGDEVDCAVCGARFYRNPGEIRRGRLYCSVACANVAQTAAPVVKPCAWCGKELRLKPSQAGINHCSKRCETEARVKRPLERLHNGRRARQDLAGYVMVWEPDHPNKTLKGWQYEHRLVAEATLGRFLRSDEAVHHINGIKHDNRPDNLEVMDGIAHLALSSRDYFDQVLRDRAELEAYRKRHGPLD